MTDRAYIVSRTLEDKIAVAENNDQNVLFVTIDALKEIIAVMKQETIVQCKDCKHSKDEYGGMFCPKFGFVHQEDWFCADGEREGEV